jgi:hypothetical protein
MTRETFSYEVTQQLAVLSQNGAISKELNLISYNGEAPKYDLRTWRRTPEKVTLMKGLTLSDEEMELLKDAIAKL